MRNLFILFLSAGFLLMTFSLPALLCWIRPHSAYGICIGAALQSEANWYKINFYGGWQMFRAGLGTMLFATGFYFIPHLSAGAYYLSCSVVLLGLFLIGLFRLARLLQQYNSSR